MQNASQLPKINTYGNYSSDNYGAHALVMEIGPLTVWFSYKTPIAFQIDGKPRVIRRNDWSATTGKHLNRIDSDKSKRISGEQFEWEWEKQVVPALKRLMRAA